MSKYNAKITEDNQVLEIKEGYGFSSIKRSYMAFLMTAFLLFASQMVTPVEGEPSDAPMFFWAAGFVFFIGLIALFYRRKLVLDKMKQTVISSWGFLTYNVKSKYQFSQIAGLLLTIGEKQTASSSTTGENTSSRRTLHLVMNEAGENGEDDSSFHLFIFETHRKKTMMPYMKDVSDFLDIEPTVKDFRSGMEKKLSEFIEDKFR